MIELFDMGASTITIKSNLESIKRNKRVDLLINGEGLINYLSITSTEAEIGFVSGEIKSIDISLEIRESIIKNIILGLKSGEIQINKKYNYRAFIESTLKINHLKLLNYSEPRTVDTETTTEEVNAIVEMIEVYNSKNGIRTETIRNDDLHFINMSTTTLENSTLNDTDVEKPKLPKIPGGEITLFIGIIGGVLAITFVVLGLVYLFRYRRRQKF